MTKQTDDTVLPRHVAIIMDGNRRWARARFLPSLEGHRRGVKAVRRAVRACSDLNIPALTLYTFSTENWKRSEKEVSALMNLLAVNLRREAKALHAEGVRFRALGRIDALPDNVKNLVHEMEDLTRNNSKLLFNIALNYGGRQELVDATRAIAEEVKQGSLDVDQIDEEIINAHLTTAPLPELDLLIRTGGEQRVSNFLLWQLAYTELVFLPIYWPEFDKSHLDAAIAEFNKRERRFGATP